MSTSRAIIDLEAVACNTRALKNMTDSQLMAILKADAYGHGAARTAWAMVDGGASRLGVAQLTEAMELRESLPNVPLWTWMYSLQEDLAPAIEAGVELSIGSMADVRHVAGDAARAGKQARVHLALDSGMSREGVRPEKWEELVDAALKERSLDVIGLWSHLARADEKVSTTAEQIAIFTRALEQAEALGAKPETRHLAATSGIIWHPDAHFDMVRAGIGMYGLMPDGSNPYAYGLTPAMTVEASLISVKDVPANTPVSYGGTAIVGPAQLGLVPLGYGDGIPRQASNRGWVMFDGQMAPVVGRICMDQFAVKLPEGSNAQVGDTVTVFGVPDPQGNANWPTADTWGQASDSVNYTIVTQMGSRVPREFR